MKRLWNLAALALLACAGLATPIQASGSFGLFYCGRHCDKCAVCIRPYNAFTPVLCGDVCGYNCGGCGGPGGCAQGGCSPIACPCGYGCGQGNCGYGCGQGGCWGHKAGWNPHHGMANVNPLAGTPYTGALGYDPADGLGNGAFGTVGCGRLSVFGNPSCGAGCCAGGACQNLYGPTNHFNPPMACGPQGCAPAYGFGMNFGAPSFAPVAGGPIMPNEVKPTLLQVPNKVEPKQAPQARSTFDFPTQPVSYMPTYPAAGQQMYGYTQPAWGYYGYQAPTYPAWGYQGW